MGISMKIKKVVYIVTGCAGVALGAVGAAVPLLPSFPFLLLAAVCFGKSSERLHTWFTGTKLYKNNLESYVQERKMTWKTKIRIMLTVTLIMSVGFIMMGRVPVGRIILACVWVLHIIYFCFGVKTLQSRMEVFEDEVYNEY
ncbi:MAG: YbaN family protein [Bacteroides sp.]